jgi:toxin ParE1/3/4
VALFRWTAQAEEDLIDIWLRIAEDNPAAADKQLDVIEAACAVLAEHPQMGPGRPDLATELRYWVVGEYLVLYRETAGSIEVVRVVHGRRNLPDLF